MKIRMLRNIAIMIVACISALASRYAVASEYTWSEITIACHCNKATVGTFFDDDFDWNQSPNNQLVAWLNEMSTWGFCSGDRVGNRTKKYNCFSFVFNGSDRWVNSPSPWLVTSNDPLQDSGCWTLFHANPTAFVSGAHGHACLIADELGKCANQFLCKHNHHVYGQVVIETGVGSTWIAFGKIQAL